MMQVPGRSLVWLAVAASAFVVLTQMRHTIPAATARLAGPTAAPVIPATPGVTVIQAAYQDAKAEAPRGRHVDDLSVSSADCSQISVGRFYCQIGYLRTRDDAADHLYFTVVTMERTEDRWILKTGLCRGDGHSG